MCVCDCVGVDMSMWDVCVVYVFVTSWADMCGCFCVGGECGGVCV